MRYQSLGEIIFNIVAGYQIGLLFLSLANIVFFGMYVYFLRKTNTSVRFRWLWLGIEVIYGLCNPVVYLITLQTFWSSRLLNGLAVICLFCYWGTRFFLPLRTYPKKLKHVVRFNILFCLGVLSLFFLKDIVYFIKDVCGSRFSPHDLIMGMSFGIFLSLYYLIPFLILIFQYRKTYSPSYWKQEPHYLLLAKYKILQYIPVSIGLVAILCIAPFMERFQEEEIKTMLLHHKPVILEQAQKYQVDPRLIASIIAVNHRNYISPFRYHAEQFLMGIWLQDSKSHLGFSKKINISIGFCQIKPVTAQTSLAIYCWNHRLGNCFYKQGREIPYIEKQWALAQKVTQAPHLKFYSLSKQLVVSELLTPEKSIEYCAYILSLYALQWEDQNPAWSIRERPEILASLYQIGFEKSHPKATPKANTFGKRVKQVYESEWISQHFSPEHTGQTEESVM